MPGFQVIQLRVNGEERQVLTENHKTLLMNSIRNTTLAGWKYRIYPIYFWNRIAENEHMPISHRAKTSGYLT